MSEITTIGRDLARNVFQVHEVGCTSWPVLRKRLWRAQARESSRQLRAWVVEMKARGGPQFSRAGVRQARHDVRLIRPAV